MKVELKRFLGSVRARLSDELVLGGVDGMGGLIGWGLWKWVEVERVYDLEGLSSSWEGGLIRSV